ncbi:MAG: protease modulator HflC [Desulfohalobiaceae bacterium]|nr:protease modulator HflC [Desulfohalobiaceae bacterium]
MAQAKFSPVAGVVILLLLVLGVSQSFYIVDQTQRGLLLQMGDPVKENVPPGLHFKMPLIQDAVIYDHRILEYDAQPKEVVTKEKKALVVDNYARWRIEDTLAFYRTARTVDGGISRLNDIVYSQLRVALGRHTLNEIVTTQRNEIMRNVADQAAKELDKFGIKLIDVRIKRTDLPEENQKAIFERMRSERKQQARKYRSEGREEAEELRAEAEKERSIMLAEARRKAQSLRGEGDAKATAVYAASYGKSPEFYAFTRSMELYRQSLGNKTSLLLTPQSELFQYFRSMDGQKE